MSYVVCLGGNWVNALRVKQTQETEWVIKDYAMKLVNFLCQFRSIKNCKTCANE